MRRHTVIALILLGAAVLSACEQTTASFPEQGNAAGGASACGPWYPGGGGDAGATYAVEKGDTFPCLVWSSVRRESEDTWFNAGELYLETVHGARDARALVMIYSGKSCPTCVELVARIKQLKAEFQAEAVMLAAALPTFGAEEGFTLDEAVQTLVVHDGWPSEWLVTNDEEGHLTNYESFPWIVVVRLSDMKVVVKTNFEYGPGNVDELLELVKTL